MMRLVRPEKILISASHLDALLTILLIIGSVALCFWIVLPFLGVLTWAVTLAVLFLPMQRRLEQACHHPGLAALCSTLIVSTVVIVPMLWATQQLSLQLYISAQTIQQWLQSAPWQHSTLWQQVLSEITVKQYSDHLQSYLDVPNLIKLLNNWLLGSSANIFKYSINSLLHICLVFYVVFFLLRDRQLAIRALNTLSPIADQDVLAWLHHINATIKAVVYGTLVIASIQGLLGGLMFWYLGLSSPLLWGCVMALVSILPMLGAFLVWVPAAIYLLLSQQWQQALMLSLWGLLVVGTIDNFLRPYWVSRELSMHPLQIFFSVIGGLVLFGPSGLILGPVMFASTHFLLTYWKAQARLQTESVATDAKD